MRHEREKDLAVRSSFLVATAAAVVLVGCFLPVALGTWLLATGAVLLPVSLMILGARRHGGFSGRARLVLSGLAFVLGGTLATLILLHRAGRAGAAGLLLQLAGLWFLPLLLTGLGYAVAFPRARARTRTDSRAHPES